MRSAHEEMGSHPLCVREVMSSFCAELFWWQHREAAIEVCLNVNNNLLRFKNTFLKGFGDVLMTLQPDEYDLRCQCDQH